MIHKFIDLSERNWISFDMKDLLKWKGNNDLHSPPPKKWKEKMKIKSQLLVFGIIQSPIWFWTCVFLRNFWTVKCSTLTHRIFMKSWHSQIFIYSDFSSLGNNRDLFGWLNTETVLPSKHGYLLTLFFHEMLVTLSKDNFLRKILSFPSRFHLL